MLSPVQAWIGVPEPRTHYMALGISRDEPDRRVIEEAALCRAECVRAYQLTHGPECTRLLGQIALALITLLDPVKRREYDRGLGGVARHAGSKRLRTAISRGAAADTPCDVHLVCRHWRKSETVIT
jgi:hypothetical protein